MVSADVDIFAPIAISAEGLCIAGKIGFSRFFCVEVNRAGLTAVRTIVRLNGTTQGGCRSDYNIGMVNGIRFRAGAHDKESGDIIQV